VSDSTITILERARHLLEGWRSTNRKQTPSSQVHTAVTTSLLQDDDQTMQNRDRDARWRKPRSGRLKCNVDASFSNSNNKVGIGMCIRDSAGNHVRSVDVGEALGLYYAIRWIDELQLTNVDFEVDSKKVANYFNSGRGDITKFGSIMDNSVQFCDSFSTNSHVEFIRRQSNVVAHELAKAVTSS